MGAPGWGDFHTALRTEGFERRGALLGVAVKPNENTHASLLSAGRSRDSKGVGCGSDYPSSRHISRLPAQACFPGCRDMKTRSLHTHAPKNGLAGGYGNADSSHQCGVDPVRWTVCRLGHLGFLEHSASRRRLGIGSGWHVARTGHLRSGVRFATPQITLPPREGALRALRAPRPAVFWERF